MEQTIPRKSQVYSLTCLKNNRVYYGHTVQKLYRRVRNHVDEAAWMTKGPLYDDIRAHGIQAFEAKTLVRCLEDYGCEVEKRLIARCRANYPGRCYNRTEGGEPLLRKSKAAREKHSKLMKRPETAAHLVARCKAGWKARGGRRSCAS